MRTLFFYPLLLLVASALGCTRILPCKEGTILVTTSLGGAAAAADQIELTVLIDGQPGTPSRLMVSPDVAVGTVEVDFSTYPAGHPVTLIARALRGGAELDSTSVGLSPKAGCDTVDIALGLRGSVTADAAVTDGALPSGATLTVTRQGAGGGAVVSDVQPGLDCGGVCVAQYPVGTRVTLTAKPDAMSDFTGWSGACTGTGSCVVTLTGSTEVMAQFNRKCSPGTFCPQTGPGTNALYAIWGTSPRDLWVSDGSQSIFHFDGSRWSTFANATSWVNGIWGSSSNDIWGASPSYGGLNVHFDGSAWTAVGQGAGGSLYDVSGTASNDVWSVGELGIIMHWDGTGWSRQTSGSNASLRGVYASASGNAWAVGPAGLMLHRVGNWTSVPSGTSQNLNGIWGSGANDIWAVGEAGTMLHWDGSSWIAANSGTTATLRRIFGSSSNNVWAVGDAGNILHYNGSGTWIRVASGTLKSLYGVWTGGGEVWVVGSGGILRATL